MLKKLFQITLNIYKVELFSKPIQKQITVVQSCHQLMTVIDKILVNRIKLIIGQILMAITCFGIALSC